jgi:hypothetical protein
VKLDLPCSTVPQPLFRVPLQQLADQIAALVADVRLALAVDDKFNLRDERSAGLLLRAPVFGSVQAFDVERERAQ